MKKISWQVWLAVALVALSALIYFFHYILWEDAHHIFIYLVGDIAFVPVEVLMVTLIIHRLLGEREKRAMLKKLNMVIGAFFSEVGTGLMERFVSFDENFEKVRPNLIIELDWKQQDFRRIRKNLDSYDYNMASSKGDLSGLKEFLQGRRAFLLRLLENPSLLEHESFTELLWAVFHLEEELSNRKDVENLPASDYEHLSGDMKRTYVLLIREWCDYMNHLRISYPYLYSLAVRTNPFNPDASPEVVS